MLQRPSRAFTFLRPFSACSSLRQSPGYGVPGMVGGSASGASCTSCSAIGPKPSLPSSVFAFALHDYFWRRQNRTETMSIQECLYGEASPGQVFKLDENSLIEYVEELEDTMGGSIILDETAGLKQIYRRQSFDPLKVLDNYYR